MEEKKIEASNKENGKRGSGPTSTESIALILCAAAVILLIIFVSLWWIIFFTIVVALLYGYLHRLWQLRHGIRESLFSGAQILVVMALLLFVIGAKTFVNKLFESSIDKLPVLQDSFTSDRRSI